MDGDENKFNPAREEEISISELPIIDNHVKKDLEVYRVAIARELFSLFVNTLGEEQDKIGEAYRSRDYRSLYYLLHKLHGSTCYCGTPRLKEAAALAGAALQERAYIKLGGLLVVLDKEIKLVMNYAKRTRFLLDLDST